MYLRALALVYTLQVREQKIDQVPPDLIPVASATSGSPIPVNRQVSTGLISLWAGFELCTPAPPLALQEVGLDTTVLGMRSVET